MENITTLQQQIDDLKQQIKQKISEKENLEKLLQRTKIFAGVEEIVAKLPNYCQSMLAAKKDFYLRGDYSVGEDLLVISSFSDVLFILSADTLNDDNRYDVTKVNSSESPKYIMTGTVEQILNYFNEGLENN